jgi:O-antigen ligase
MAHDPDDPTKISNQPSLTTSEGTVWLVVGGLMAAIAVAMLLALSRIDTSGVALIAIGAIALLYVAMIEVRLLTRVLRLRLILLAICFSAIAVVGLGAVVLVGAAQVAP